MFKALITLTFVFSCSIASAEDLRLHLEKNHIGVINLYIENIGDVSHTILTSDLGVTTSGNKATISPDQHVWIKKGKKILLKESIARHYPVTLKPGEITYISNSLIKPETTTVVYEIENSWAAMHGLWNGKLDATLQTI